MEINEIENFEMENNGYTHLIPQANHILHPYYNSNWNQNSVNFLPHDIQADSAFIERAAKYSCFNGGNVSAILDTFSNSDPMVIRSDRIQNEDILVENGKQRELENNEGESSGFGGEEVLNKKRRRSNKGNETNRGEETIREEKNVENEEKGEEEEEKQIEKNKKDGSKNTNINDENKEEYIHVRARRGQATTSHSLAERLRREKISERMKYLQDLVPGCSKVTGKAVMLDEIINYVQSLQRQVEFLSMKLSAVNPRVDLNIETILTRNLFNLNAGPSLSHLSQQNNYFDPNEAIRRIENAQLCTNNRFKDPSSQVCNDWDGVFQNVMQTAFDVQELNRDGFRN